MHRLLVLAAVCVLSAASVEAGEVTYTKDVAPILWNRCAGCHRAGEVGPFSLLTYEDAAKRADHIRDITAEGRMPPWKAEKGFGQFQDERRLTDDEKQTLSAWAEAGAPFGDAKDLPPAPQFADGWQLGEPDLVLEMPDEVTIPASGRDEFRAFVLPMNLTQDQTVGAVEFRPGNRRVVHHALFFLDTTGRAREMDEADPEPGYHSFGGIGIQPTGGLGGWAPGATPRHLPDGVGRMVRKGSDLVLQIHYHPSGKEERDRSMVGIYFTEDPAKNILTGIPLLDRSLYIPAGEPRHKVEIEFTVPVNVHAYGITPHMHLLGREMKITATLPDGRIEPLVWVRDWDFNWQDQYLYVEPVALPRGSVVHLEAYYDNSADNPQNPTIPPKEVTWGEQTTDEMCLCGIQVVPDSSWGYLGLRAAVAQHVRSQFTGGGRALRALRER